MAIETSQPRSPGWWLDRLLTKLSERRDHLNKLDNYYSGDAVAPVLATKAVRESYRRLMSMSRTNFAELVVEAVRERMNPAGFRTGADDNDLGDKEAWRIWQANQLDADSALVHRASLSMGDGYVIVGPVDKETGAPTITAEDPREVITEHDPVRKRRVRAAVKQFHDDVLGVEVAYLYLPGVVYRATAEKPQSDGHIGVSEWDWVDAGQRLPGPVVPVVRFPNRADLSGSAKAEFEPHIPILDRINFTILSRVEIATLQAYRQRGIKGDLPKTDDSGQDIDYDDVFSADPGALWQLPTGIDIWESQSIDLGPVRSAIRDDVQDLAAVTRTPLFYLTPEANTGSAEGASLSREGLVFKTYDRLVQAGESWEQVMALAFTFAGDTERASRADMEVIWSSPERVSMSERYDAATKAQAVGVPFRTIATEILGYSPQQVERMASEQAEEALQRALLAPPQQAPPEEAPVDANA